jgi:Zn-dependent peptidase ImmA (M78 family)
MSFIDFYYTRSCSYTLNKTKIFINTDGKSKGRVNLEIIHEFTHCLCKEIGHTEDYWTLFNEILSKAIHDCIDVENYD